MLCHPQPLSCVELPGLGLWCEDLRLDPVLFPTADVLLLMVSEARRKYCPVSKTKGPENHAWVLLNSGAS